MIDGKDEKPAQVWPPVFIDGQALTEDEVEDFFDPMEWDEDDD